MRAKLGAVAAAIVLLCSTSASASPLTRGNILLNDGLSQFFNSALLRSDGSVVEHPSRVLGSYYSTGIEIDDSDGVYVIDESISLIQAPSGYPIGYPLPSPCAWCGFDLALDAAGRLYFNPIPDSPAVMEVDVLTGAMTVVAAPEVNGHRLSFEPGGLAVFEDGSFLVGPRNGNTLYRFGRGIHAEVFQTITTGVGGVGGIDVDLDGTILIGDYTAPLMERRSLTGELLQTYTLPIPRVVGLAVSPIPEPDTLSLVALGLTALAAWRRGTGVI